MSFVPKKLYYKIREVCEIVGVEAHVLRFWEAEFPALSPPKSKSGQRTYRPKDIELLLRIKKLLYEEGFTIAGARKRLNAGNAGARENLSAGDTGDSAEDAPALADPPEAKHQPQSAAENLRKVKAELETILTLLDRE